MRCIVLSNILGLYPLDATKTTFPGHDSLKRLQTYLSVVPWGWQIYPGWEFFFYALWTPNVTLLPLLNDICYFLEDPAEIWRETSTLQNTINPQDLHQFPLWQPDWNPGEMQGL